MQSSVTVHYCTATTDSLYSHSTWITNTVCSLFRYFVIILFAAYIVNRRKISVRFSWKFSSFFHVVSVETSLFRFFQNCISVTKENSLGGAIVLLAAYSVYAWICKGFSHPIFRRSLTASPSISVTEIVHINSIGGGIINLFAVYSAHGRISVRFFIEFSDVL